MSAPSDAEITAVIGKLEDWATGWAPTVPHIGRDAARLLRSLQERVREGERLLSEPTLSFDGQGMFRLNTATSEQGWAQRRDAFLNGGSHND